MIPFAASQRRRLRSARPVRRCKDEQGRGRPGMAPDDVLCAGIRLAGVRSHMKPTDVGNGAPHAPKKKCGLVTRRRFLYGLGTAIVVAACDDKTIAVYGNDPTTTTVGQTTPTSTLRGSTSTTTLRGTIPAGTIPQTDRTLVIVEFGGGNDGLATILPHSTNAYYDMRKDTAIHDPIDLDGDIGLHPALSTISSMYSAGQVAIVEGVGCPDPNLSHFEFDAHVVGRQCAASRHRQHRLARPVPRWNRGLRTAARRDHDRPWPYTGDAGPGLLRREHPGRRWAESTTAMVDRQP